MANDRAGPNRRGDTVNSTLAEARLIGLCVLGELAVASVGIGWIASRMLRPVHALARTARGVGDLAG
jgi:hypothetical protein